MNYAYKDMHTRCVAELISSAYTVKPEILARNYLFGGFLVAPPILNPPIIIIIAPTA